MHLLHAGDHGALQQLFKARVLLEGQVEGLMRPVGQTPYAVAVGLQIRQQLDHARKRAGQRVRVVADVELEDVGEFLALFAYHIRVDVREILAGVHAVLVAEEAAGVVVGADAFHDLIGESAFQACAGVPVQQHAAEVENHVGDGGVGHDAPCVVGAVEWGLRFSIGGFIRWLPSLRGANVRNHAMTSAMASGMAWATSPATIGWPSVMKRWRCSRPISSGSCQPCCSDSEAIAAARPCR